MIGRRSAPEEEEQQEDVRPKGFDDFELLLGDIMRGERATLGKSLLDVQRELKIKATYIAAIENTDTTAFETPGFIAGYVRSYARYLNLDPDWAYSTFCQEADFQSVSGLEKGAAQATPTFRKSPVRQKTGNEPRDPIAEPKISFVPANSGAAFGAIEPRAIGSLMVLVALIGAIGYGGWSVLQEIQRVQVAPVERAPGLVAEVDPLAAAVAQPEGQAPQMAGVSAATPDSLDRLYRPQALDVPVMVPRDGPIAALDPGEVGALPSAKPDQPVDMADFGLDLPAAPASPRVTAEAPEVMLVAIRPAWVRVRSADGSILFEKTLNAGETYVVPQTEEPPTLRAGAAGGVYFSVNGETYGPAGALGTVASNVALSPDTLTETFALADPTENSDAKEAVRVAEAVLTAPAEQPDGE